MPRADPAPAAATAEEVAARVAKKAARKKKKNKARSERRQRLREAMKSGGHCSFVDATRVHRKADFFSPDRTSPEALLGFLLHHGCLPCLGRKRSCAPFRMSLAASVSRPSLQGHAFPSAGDLGGFALLDLRREKNHSGNVLFTRTLRHAQRAWKKHRCSQAHRTKPGTFLAKIYAQRNFATCWARNF